MFRRQIALFLHSRLGLSLNERTSRVLPVRWRADAECGVSCGDSIRSAGSDSKRDIALWNSSSAMEHSPRSRRQLDQSVRACAKVEYLPTSARILERNTDTAEARAHGRIVIKTRTG